MARFVTNISKQAVELTAALVGICANVDSYSTEVLLKDLLKRAMSFTGKTND